MIKKLNKNEIIDFVFKTPEYYNLSKQESLNRIGFDSSIFPVEYVQDFYANKVFSEPTDSEINKLIPAIKQADLIVDKIMNRIGINKKLDWNIGKINNGFDWNYPQTREEVIFLPEYFFDNPDSKILAHEKIHIYQRKFPKIFDEIYKSWGLKKIKLNEKEKQSIYEYNLSDRLIKNPDTTNFDKWVYPIGNDYYILPVYIINSNGKPTNVGFKLDLKNRDGNMYFTSDLSAIYDRYNSKQIDHPNEIFACKMTGN
jgi:hypothetical protein